MSCEDIPSLLDLQKVKKHADDFGRLMGTGIGTSTNGVTGQVRPTFNKVINDMRVDFNQRISDQESEFNQHISGMAFTRVGTFKSGATLDDLREVLLWDVSDGGDGHEYGWTGPFQKVVAPNSTPSSSGGVGAGAWVDRTDVTLRSELAALGGAGLVDGLAKPVTWVGFAGGADPTGVINSDASFSAADVYDGDVYVPPGIYNISLTHRGNYIVDSEAEFTGPGLVMLKRRKLWATPGLPVNAGRYPRLFVGDAAYDHAGVSSTNDQYVTWLGKKDIVAPNGSLQPGEGWVEKNATGASYGSYGTIGFAAAAHNKVYGGGAAIGLAAMAVNDLTDGHSNVWALYASGKQMNGAEGTTWGAEITVATLGRYHDLHDYTTAGKTFGVSLQAGGDSGINLVTEDVTCALAIGSSGAKWGVGISTAVGVLREFTESTIEPYQKAILLRKNQRIGWEDSNGATLGYVTSRVSNPTMRAGITLRNQAIDFDNDTGSGHMLRISYDPGNSSYFRMRTASPANPIMRFGIEGGAADVTMRIEAAGEGTVQVNKNFEPALNNSFFCGTSLLGWKGGFTQAAFTVLSDDDYKTEKTSISDAVLDAWAEVDYCQYKFKTSIELKGDGARIHVGVIAQRVTEAFARHNLDACAYGLLCFDKWDDEYIAVNTNEDVTVTHIYKEPKLKTEIVIKSIPVEALVDGEVTTVYEDREVVVPVFKAVEGVDKDGNKFIRQEAVFEDVDVEYEEPAEPDWQQQLVRPAGQRYGIRYEEALALEAALQRRNYQRLLSRIEALEGN